MPLLNIAQYSRQNRKYQALSKQKICYKPEPAVNFNGSYKLQGLTGVELPPLLPLRPSDMATPAVSETKIPAQRVHV